MRQSPEREPVTPDSIQGVTHRETLREVILLFPIVAIKVGSEGPHFVEALELAGSSI